MVTLEFAHAPICLEGALGELSLRRQPHYVSTKSQVATAPPPLSSALATGKSSRISSLPFLEI